MTWTDRWRRWSRRWGRRWTGSTCAPEDPAERVAAIGRRLAALELERLELLADESVPGRKHRLDAVDAARRDLEAERDDPPGGARPAESEPVLPVLPVLPAGRRG